MNRPASESSEPGGDIETDGSGVARPSADRSRNRFGGAPRTNDSRSRTGGLRSRVNTLVSRTRIGQFLTVGLVGALLDNALLVALHGPGGLSLPLAKLASAEAAILFMFACNERWTFAGWGTASLKALARRLVTSNLVRFGGVVVATGVLLVLAEVGVWYVLANLLGIGVGALLNYVAESLLTWRVHRE